LDSKELPTKLAGDADETPVYFSMSSTYTIGGIGEKRFAVPKASHSGNM
jgi:hypothetical protein